MPTDKPSPTSPANREVHTMSATETLPTRPMEVPSKIPPRAPAVWSIKHRVPENLAKSPTELPVPTDKPSPTSALHGRGADHRPHRNRNAGAVDAGASAVWMSSAFFSMPCISGEGFLRVASESFLLNEGKRAVPPHVEEDFWAWIGPLTQRRIQATPKNLCWMVVRMTQWRSQ